MEEQLLPFIDSLLEDKNLAGMTPEAFAILRKDMAGDLRKQIDHAIIDQLSEKQADAFSELMDQPDTTDDTLQQFIANTGMDVSAVVASTMARFRKYYLGE